MRYRTWLLVLSLALTACSGAFGGGTTLTLKNPDWERVNVEVVITKRTDCNARDAGYIATKELVMRKDKSETIDVPEGANVCWRHDRNPDKPVAGAWSGWTRATLFPGQSANSDL